MVNTFMLLQLTSPMVDQICKTHLAVFQKSVLLRVVQQNKHKRTIGPSFFEEEHFTAFWTFSVLQQWKQ